MSVYRCDYIIYGWKLPYTQELSNKLKVEGTNSYEYWDGGKEGCELIMDGMGGHYIVFGKVIYKNNYPYANEESVIEFENLTLPSMLMRDEVKFRYRECFSIEEGAIAEPYTFIFSHIY
jgi:hypothetical protein